MGKNDRQPTPDELRLWREAASADQPRVPSKPRPHSGPAGANIPKRRSPVQSPGALGKHEARAIKRGSLAIDDRIDLHGMTQDIAHDELTGFIQDAARRGHKCVLVITGKGTPRNDREDIQSMLRRPGVLRTVVPGWLSGPELSRHIIGFQPALPRDGGGGALYVLLRRG